MARHRRSSALETKTARLRLAVRKKPYFLSIAPGVHLGFRRCKTAGRWIARAKDWSKVFALADDNEDANGVQVLDFWQAQDRCRELVRGHSGGSRPVTVKEALLAYKTDLVARGSGKMNATRVLRHLDDNLANKSVALLKPGDLKQWRDRLIASGMKSATAHRTSKMMKAALNLAALHDERITNSLAWRTGLPRLKEQETQVSKVLDDNAVRAIIKLAYAKDATLGLFIETAATTGQRPSQLLRLKVSDLRDGDAPTLMMPSSRKGKNRVITSQPIPISPSLGKALRQHAADRGHGEPLFVNSATRPRRQHDYRYHWNDIIAELGIESSFTFYSLRHTSITRMLLKGAPARLVASAHDTSLGIMEKVYSRFIVHSSDAVLRAALLDVA